MNNFWRTSYSARSSQSRKSFVFNKQNWHWSLTVTMIGWFVGVIVVFYYFTSILIQWYELLFLWLAIGTLGIFVHQKIKKARRVFKILGSGLFVAYNFFGLAPIFLALYMIINVHIQLPESKTITYKIIGLDKEYMKSHAHGIQFILEDYQMQEFPSVRRFDIEVTSTRAERPYIRFEIGKGVLGLPIYNGRRLVSNPSKPSSP